ncbi:MAG: PD40 domain-containing protein [Candidatus Aminicenantes bacterium]|nr:PD40 domain-containing protein [Candidatus Aminicenantes bacterium]
MKRISFFLLAGLILASIPSSSQDIPILAQKPALSRTHVVFVYAGDLWKVPREGGAAHRLTTGPGVETNAVFSPDGSLIAFTGEYDGNVDVFVMPAEGGVPRRLTWHPAGDIALGWSSDGKKVLFTSTRTAFSRFSELFTIGVEGGFPERLPLPMGYEGSFSSDGKRLAYVPLRRAFTAWKRYRGGTATPIWIADLSDSRIEKIPRTDSNDYDPMWVGDKVYFLSDREGPVTLFSYDVNTKNVTRALDNDGLDLKSASAGPGAIVYEQFGSLHLYDLASKTSSPLPVSIAGDMLEVRDKFANVGDSLSSPSLSPNAVRAAFEARGEIITVPAEKGDFRNLTNTPGAMERYPAWSPDGEKVACFSDESGDYQLHIRDHKGNGEPVRITLEADPTFYYAPRWSPDNKKIAYADCHLNLWYVDLETKKPVKVDKDRFLGGASGASPNWSPDSKWLVYSKQLPNYLGAIFLYSLENGRSTQITDGMSDARRPVFDPGGKYLYFTASTDSGASLQPDIHSIFRDVTSSIYLAVLDKEEPTPFTPQSDEEKAEDKSKKESEEPEKKEEKKGEKAGERAEDKPDKVEKPDKEVKVKIDLEDILQRILAVPMPARNYIDLQTGESGTLLAVAAEAPPPGAFFPQGAAVHRFDLKERRADVVISGVNDFEMAGNAKKYLYSRRNRWLIGTLKPMPPAGAPSPPPSAAAESDKAMPTQNIQIRVKPREEWRQMYREAWRIEREFFYDPNLHGLNLEKAQKKYAPFVKAVASRMDLNYLFAEMLGEMTVGHLGVGGGDIPRPERIPTGLLGADYVIENGRYRFARVYSGENWNPQFQAPLTQPGVNVRAGEYLLAVDGREVKGTDNIFRFFEAKAGRQVVLTVGPEPKMEGSREVTVVPISSETSLRNFAWIEDNRRYVERATKGKAAYVYMPDTAFGGYTYFNRYFYAQVDREALIVDERFNGGGMLATDIIERFQRRLMSLVATRDGEDEVQPQGAIFGPKVMLINEFAGSGGDAMPWYFRQAKVGPLIGKRTWGGLVGRAGAPRLMDGGFVSAPSSGVWSPDGHWIAENVGVPPDVEVELDPALVRQGKDPQLDKAIEIVMRELAKSPVPKPKRPAYPDYHKK